MITGEDTIGAALEGEDIVAVLIIGEDTLTDDVETTIQTPGGENIETPGGDGLIFI